MFGKVKNSKIIHYARQLRDVRLLGLFTFAILALLVAWNSIGAIQANFKLQQQIAILRQENEVQHLRNENLRFGNEYYSTDQYLELAARRNFGLAAPGETVVNVPENIALSKTIDVPEPVSDEITQEADEPSYKKNFSDWMDFLLNRQARL